MLEGIINRALRKLVVENGADLKEVQQYLLLKFKIEVEQEVLQKRVQKFINSGKAVA